MTDREIFEKCVEELGYEVEEATTPQDIELCKQFTERPDKTYFAVNLDEKPTFYVGDVDTRQVERAFWEAKNTKN